MGGAMVGTARAGREPGPIILRRAALPPARRRLGRALHGPRRRRAHLVVELAPASSLSSDPWPTAASGRRS